MRLRAEAGTIPPPICVILAWVLSGCADPEPVTIGASMGVPAVEAARLALQEPGAADLGVDTLLAPDPSNLARRAIGIAGRWTQNSSLIAVVGHGNSESSLGAASTYNKAEVVLLAPHTTATLYSQAGPYSFRMVPPDREQGRFLANRLLERFGDDVRMAVLYVNDDYGRGLRDAIRNGLRGSRAAVVLQIPHRGQPASPEFKGRTIRALEASEPDVVLWLGRGYTLRSMLPELRERLPDVPVWDGDAVGLLSSTEDAYLDDPNLFWADFFHPPSGPEAADFFRRYRARMGRDPTTSEILTYDAVKVILAGIRAGARTGPELREYLLTLGRSRPAFEGLSGPVSFSEEGDVARAYVMRSSMARGDNP